MLTIRQIKQRLSDANLKRVAIKSGVHPATVYRFMRGQVKPTYETVELLSNYLTQAQVDEVDAA
jgi:predicted transcriptional regulator